MWIWMSESRNLSIYQDLSLLLGLTYGKLWNVESQRNEYTGNPYNIYKWRNVLSRFQIHPATFFSMHNWLSDLDENTTPSYKVMESAEKEALAGSEERSTENSPFFFLFPNNIFIITTLHLLPLLQISCWKKWTRTKDPGESWDSALIGKPFNILKYNLTFLSIEEPLWGRVAGGGIRSILTETF